MKNFRHYALLSVSALCLLCPSCTDDTPTPVPVDPVAPTIAFGPICRVEGTTVTFTLLTTDAEKAAYLLTEREGDVPDAAEVMREGVVLTGRDVYTVTEEHLGRERGYIVYAAAVNGTILSEMAQIEFTAGFDYDGLLTVTGAEKNSISYHIESEPGESYRHVALMDRVVRNFTDGVQSEQEYAQRIQLLLSIYGMQGTGPLDFTLHDMDLRSNGQPYDVLAGTGYSVMACRTDAAGNYVGQYQIGQIVTPNPLDNGLHVAVGILDLQPGELTVLCTPDPGLLYFIEQPFPRSLVDQLLAEGGKQALLEQFFTVGTRTTEFGEPAQWTFLNPQTEYVHYVMGVDEQGDRTELFAMPFTTPEELEADVDTENLRFDHAIMGFYYGELQDDGGEPSYNFYCLLADRAMLPDEYGDPYPDSFPCHAINCDFYCGSVAEALVLPEGVYTYAETSEAGSWSPGYTWAAYFDQEAEQHDFSFVGGTITVTHRGTDYQIEFDLRTEKGKVYTGSYTGPIDFEDSATTFGLEQSRWTRQVPRWRAPLRR